MKDSPNQAQYDLSNEIAYHKEKEIIEQIKARRGLRVIRGVKADMPHGPPEHA